jgi:hypothetical protein
MQFKKIITIYSENHVKQIVHYVVKVQLLMVESK